MTRAIKQPSVTVRPLPGSKLHFNRTGKQPRKLKMVERSSSTALRTATVNNQQRRQQAQQR
jgi:hypothetical protein